ncbi:MAG TPA: T9SS type A sorting domain-containing protein, partial [Flavobacteriaceae bacterium]|nr:T9SS type A sorting domain-containing protein [Flavobacteriaceae bacterium]
NPTFGIISIKKPNDLEIDAIRIFNALGQLLYTNNWKPTVDISSLSSGLLFVQFQTNKGVINKSLLKTE